MVELVLRALFHLIEEKATVIISRFLPEAKNLPLQRRCEGIHLRTA
jgi:hypothetical protein